MRSVTAADGAGAMICTSWRPAPANDIDEVSAARMSLAKS
jgi:hypothetical protein